MKSTGLRVQVSVSQEDKLPNSLVSFTEGRTSKQHCQADRSPPVHNGSHCSTAGDRGSLREGKGKQGRE